MSQASASFFSILVLFYPCLAHSVELPPCNTDDSQCLQAQLLNQVYVNEALNLRNVALERASNLAQQMKEESERRADEAESKLQSQPNTGKWFVGGALIGFGIALILHLKPFGH